MTQLVVARTFVRVGQHRVGLGRFLEFILGLRIALIAIGMMLQREFAIRALDLRVFCVPSDSKNLVVVPPTHALATLTMAGRNNLDPMR